MLASSIAHASTVCMLECRSFTPDYAMVKQRRASEIITRLNCSSCLNVVLLEDDHQTEPDLTPSAGHPHQKYQIGRYPALLLPEIEVALFKFPKWNKSTLHNVALCFSQGPPYRSWDILIRSPRNHGLFIHLGATSPKSTIIPV